jgi:hypothetical protein
MVANLQTTIPSQDVASLGVEQVMIGTITYLDTAAKNIGGLPAGGVILGAVVATTTAFNAATTNNVNIGQTDPTGTVANAYAALLAIGPVGTIATPVTALTTNVPLSRPTTITATYVPTGGGQSAGAAVVIVRFVVPR